MARRGMSFGIVLAIVMRMQKIAVYPFPVGHADRTVFDGHRWRVPHAGLLISIVVVSLDPNTRFLQGLSLGEDGITIDRMTARRRIGCVSDFRPAPRRRGPARWPKYDGRHAVRHRIPRHRALERKHRGVHSRLDHVFCAGCAPWRILQIAGAG